LWGSQSWLPPAFSRRFPVIEKLAGPEEAALKSGCTQDCLLHKTGMIPAAQLQCERRP